ncbi:MAG TPA: type I-U CRISPR-associated helicase/endonuclease Cas3, partial [Sandaracinaceae bacterium]
MEEQQASGDPWPLAVMALTATAREASLEAPSDVLPLSAADYDHPDVARRVRATKRLVLHRVDDGKVVDPIVGQVKFYAGSGAAVLVFLRTVDDVVAAVAKLKKAGLATQQLTGTMRGYERDRLVATDPIFRRFLPPSAGEGVEAASGTVVLVATSAGEVGVNLSADHLVCDLSTFDAMAQRFGRVNRFGLRDDSEVHVFHPPEDALRSGKKGKRGDGEEPSAPPDDRDIDVRRLRTLELLRRLDGDASPRALSALDVADREAAFAPSPEILPLTDVLLDAWAMTTIREPLAGRPPVSAYLHGVAEWEPPTVQVAWRDEVDLVWDADRHRDELLERYPPGALLEDFPLKPHELLSDQPRRVLETLRAAVAAHPDAEKARVWRVHEDGTVTVQTLRELVAADPKQLAGELAWNTLVLGARSCRPTGGMLTVEGFAPSAEGGSADVSEEWSDARGPRRARRFDDEPAPDGMRLIRVLRLRESEVTEDESESAGPVLWSWYERPRGGDDEGSRAARKPVRLDVHSGDVERCARRIVEGLPLDPGIRRAVILAAKHHDDGKRRRLWQLSIGNSDSDLILAKGGGRMRPRELTAYRHE